jgi:hypothetical protein
MFAKIAESNRVCASVNVHDLKMMFQVKSWYLMWKQNDKSLSVAFR